MTARHTSAEAYASLNSKAHSDRALIAELARLADRHAGRRLVRGWLT